MPKSKHRRKNKERPRPRKVEQAAAEPRRESPQWIPAVGLGLLGVGVLIILLGYLDPIARLTADFPGVGSNISLVAGFIAMMVGMVVLTRWE